MPDTVIDRVNLLEEGQPDELPFYDCCNQLIDDVKLPGVDGHDDDQENLNPVIQDYDDGEIEDQGTVEGTDLDIPPTKTNIDIGKAEEEEGADGKAESTVQQIEPREVAKAHRVPAPVQIEEPPEDPPVAKTEDDAPAPAEITGVCRSNRVRTKTKEPYIPSMKGSKYEVALAQYKEHGMLHPDTHMFFNQMWEEKPNVVEAIMTQLLLKVGLREWKEEAWEAAYSEMKQLHLCDTFRPKRYEDLTITEKMSILELHLFLKKKRTGQIKRRTVAGGNKQRNYIPKEDASSPTVATESVLLTCTVDAEEGRDVAVVDIPNAFIQTRVTNEKDMVIIRVRGVLVDMLEKIGPDIYGPYVTKDKKGAKQILLQCLNTIYETMVASLLYCSKFCKTLYRNGFELNPSDPCVANHMVKGAQQTICFHMDDCKLSHVDPQVNDEFLEVLCDEYESVLEDGSEKMVVSCRKTHKYLGMELDYRVSGLCKITMFDYIEEIIKTFEEIAPEVCGTKECAAPKNLFVVDEDTPKLDKAKAEKFHSLVMKIMFATKRARPDTGTAVSFLTTRD